MDDPRAPPTQRAWAALAAACCSLALGGCASQSDLRTVELAQLSGWLPGRYDNKDQVAQDTRAGRKVHETLAVVIVRIDAPFIGDHVFYFQEMAADDPRRVTAQRVLAFDVSDNAKIVQSVFVLAEANRWRDGQLNPDIFTSLMMPDVRRLAGCEVIWTKSGEHFAGAGNRQTCRTSSRMSGETVLIESQTELDANEFAMGERSYDLSGHLVQNNLEEPLYRFQKRNN